MSSQPSCVISIIRTVLRATSISVLAGYLLTKGSPLAARISSRCQLSHLGGKPQIGRRIRFSIRCIHLISVRRR